MSDYGRQCHGASAFTKYEDPGAGTIRYRCVTCPYSVTYRKNPVKQSTIDKLAAAQINAHARGKHGGSR